MSSTEERKYHVGLAPGEVGAYVLVPGDPFRTVLIARHLVDAKDHDFELLTGTRPAREAVHDMWVRAAELYLSIKQIIATAQVSGNFPGSPARIRYRFTLVDDRIASLAIGA